MRVKISIRALVLIAISLFCARLSMAQEPVVTGQLISGTIRDETTGKPIRNVNVFFDGTMNGTTSDSTGRFTLYSRTNARLPILLSGIGYFSKTVSDYSFGKELLITLKERTYDLDAVTITANDGMSRKDKIRIFKREFLGSSSNAKSCEILNEDDIRLTWSSKTRTLTARGDKPVIIHNKKLGYTLNFLLTEFTHSPTQTAYYGSQYFKEDTSFADPEKVEKARKNAYTGSKMHFIRALWDNKLAENDFAVLRKTKRVPYDSLVVVRDNQKYLHFSEFSPMAVVYGSQFSFLQGSVRDILIDKSGYNHPIGTVWSGVIGMQRAGDLLPFEYSPKDLPRFDYNPKDKPQDMNELPQTISAEINEIISSLDTLRSRMPAEKLYIQFDKPYYSIGDTLRMKAYLFDAAMLKGSDKSGIVYLELANDTNKVFFRRMLPVGYGLGAGNIILNDIPDGSYTLRAYTNLMRNFGEDLIFKKNFYISGNSAQNWLVNSQTVLSKQSGKDNVRLALQFNQLNKKALGLRELELRVLDGKKVFQRDKVQTDVDGKLDVNFNLPEKLSANSLSMIMADPKDASHHIVIPVPVSRDENIDLQFMPEGGNLVAGISSVVGFKAIGEDGYGVAVRGKIYNSRNEEVVSFDSAHKGMGFFELLPAAGEVYAAKISLQDGASKTYPLPGIKSSGTALRVINLKESDSIIVQALLSPGLPGPYYLIAQSRGVICYGAIIRAGSIKKIPKDIFPSGIVKFSLLSADRQALNERIAYIDHKDDLIIAVSPASALPGTRDSIALTIDVKDHDGNPVEGSFSLAVTDDSQVKTDSLAGNILTSLLLTSDLKGVVEEPAYYFRDEHKAWMDLDNLMLTQGWIVYAPIAIGGKDVFNPPVPEFAAEPELIVRGRISNLFNKGVPATRIQFFSLKPLSIRSGFSDTDGLFSFGDLPMADSLGFFLQTKNKNGRNSTLGIEVNEFKPPVLQASKQRFIPWYVNSDTTMLRQISTHAVQQEMMAPKGANLLENVVITGKKIIKESKNLNGPGESDQALNEKDLAGEPKRTLLDLFKEKIKGFNMLMWPTSNPPPIGLNKGKTFGVAFAKKLSYTIDGKEIHLVIDGVDVEQFYVPVPKPGLELNGEYMHDRNIALDFDRKNFIETFLTNILAEDVKGVEVMYNPKYNGRYNSTFGGEYLMSLSMISTDFTYVEVTTRSGNGAYMKTIPGTYLYKPMPYVNSAVFYRPKYTTKTNPMPDFRSTIHWEPDIVTDKEGKATVSFYAADRPGTYSVILEGSDMKGSVGRKMGTITIR